MADLLAQKLPNIVRVIRYEDMVADPATALRAAADLCGLPVPGAEGSALRQGGFAIWGIGGDR